MQEAQQAKVAQDIITQCLNEAQEAAAQSMTQQYEVKLAELNSKMENMTMLLVNQRQKSQQLESELSSAQDRIGGAERRAKLLEDENIKIKGELQSWNDYYAGDTTEVPSTQPVSEPHFSASSIPPYTGPLLPEFLSLTSTMNMRSAVGGNAIPTSLEIPSGSMTALSAPAVSASSFVDSGYRDGHGDEMPHSEINTGFTPQQ